MAKLKYLTMAAAILLAAACNYIPGGKTAVPGGPVDVGDGVPLQKAEQHQTDIGDIEAALEMEAMLADQSAMPNVKEDKLINAKKVLDMSTITVTEPAPSELFVSFQTKARGLSQDTPVVVRGKVMRDKEELDTFSFMMAGGAAGSRNEFKVNVLKGLAPPPQTMLLNATAEVLLLPKGTDPAGVDPATVQVPDSDTGSILSNPVRINFVNGAPAQ